MSSPGIRALSSPGHRALSGPGHRALSSRLRLALAALGTIALVALALPGPAFAAPSPADPPAGPVFDTPAPPGGQGGEQPTPRPTPRPQPTPAPALSQFPLVPSSVRLSVGYPGGDILAQAPLLVAELAGYFDAVGLEEVTISRSPDILGDVLSGALEFAVMDAKEAEAAAQENPGFQAIAGFRNYPGGTYGGDVLVATPGLVANEPSTVLAFLAAYLQSLQDFADAETAAGSIELLEGTDLRIPPEVSADWTAALEVYAPFDGGFGSLEDGDGLGELNAFLTDADGTEPDLDAFIADHTLAIAQQWAGLVPNPVDAFAGPPAIGDLVVGMPPSDGPSPITTAIDAGYFTDAGFTSVEVMEVEEPLLGALQGQLDLGILDVTDAADGAAQGLPLAALAGHANYAADGSYGGDLLAASDDVLATEGSTLSAFLIGYLRGLQDLRDEPALAPHDGGFGDRTEGGGLAELEAYLATALGAAPDMESIVAAEPLEYAQAWWGLPANPTDPTATTETTDEEAE